MYMERILARAGMSQWPLRVETYCAPSRTSMVTLTAESLAGCIAKLETEKAEAVECEDTSRPGHQEQRR